MTSKPIIVLAGLRVKDGSADDFIKLATPVVTATRKEPGCVKYAAGSRAAKLPFFAHCAGYADAFYFILRLVVPPVSSVCVVLGN